MKITLKKLGYQRLIALNESSIRAGRRQNLSPEQIPGNAHKQYIVNFKFDHQWDGQQDIRLSVILKPGVLTAWLDVSPEEFADIPEFAVSEIEWETAMCAGTPRWTA